MAINFGLEDLTNSALKRLVKQLLISNDKQEQSVMAKLSKAAKGPPAKNDLADLDEEMHGKPNTPQVEEEDDPFELEARGGGEDSDAGDSASDAGLPMKKGKKR